MPKISKNTRIGVVIDTTDTPFTDTQDISVSGPTIGTHETTSHGSGFEREFIAGLIDNGDVSFTVYADEADLSNATTALGYCKANPRTELTFYLTQSGGYRAEFSGIITDMSESHPVDGVFSVSISIKRTGEITETS